MPASKENLNENLRNFWTNFKWISDILESSNRESTSERRKRFCLFEMRSSRKTLYEIKTGEGCLIFSHFFSKNNEKNIISGFSSAILRLRNLRKFADFCGRKSMLTVKAGKTTLFS
jgi:hypothetical protein